MPLSQENFAKLAQNLSLRKEPIEVSSPIVSTDSAVDLAKGKTTFKAEEGGGLKTMVKNIAKVFGNIPSSLAKLTSSPVINAVENTGKSIDNLKTIYSNQSPIEGTKNILGSFADTYLKIGEKIYGGLDKAFNALLDNPKQAVHDTLVHLSKIGIEDPLFIPTLLYGGSKAAGTKADAISTIAKPVSEPIVDATKKVVQTASDVVDATKKIPGNVVDKVADTINPIDPGVQSQLNPTKLIPKEKLKDIPLENIVEQQTSKSEKLASYAKTAEDAVNDFSKPTPLAQAGQKGNDALEILNNKLAKQGQLKNEALGEVGAKPVSNIPELKTNLETSLSDRLGIKITRPTEAEILEGTTPMIKIENAPGRVSKISLDPADNKMLVDVINLFDGLGSKPTVQILDDAIDAVQDIIYKRKINTAVPVNSQVEGVLKQFTGKINSAVKKVAGEQYSKANAKFSYFVDIRDALNKALGAEGVRGASLMKQLFSPSGEAPRRLFADIKKLTGIDLVEEATIAKFVMENIGDARQASLLEEIIKNGSASPKSFVSAAAKSLFNKSSDPIKRAQKIINKNVGK